MARPTYSIGTLLQRADGPVDVLIRFTAAGYQRASRGFWDEPGYPVHFEDIAFVGVAFDVSVAAATSGDG